MHYKLRALPAKIRIARHTSLFILSKSLVTTLPEKGLSASFFNFVTALYPKSLPTFTYKPCPGLLLSMYSQAGPWGGIHGRYRWKIYMNRHSPPALMFSADSLSDSFFLQGCHFHQTAEIAFYRKRIEKLSYQCQSWKVGYRLNRKYPGWNNRSPWMDSHCQAFVPHWGKVVDYGEQG